MTIEDIHCRWQRARLGEEYVDSAGQRWVSVVVPHDGDPRGDVRELCSTLQERAAEPEPKRRRKGGGE